MAGIRLLSFDGSEIIKQVAKCGWALELRFTCIKLSVCMC